MPHSSGGGSHGGGFHSGGSFSGGSHHYHSSSGPAEFTFFSGSYSSRPQSGYRRYVYYDKRGRYHNTYYKGPKPKAIPFGDLLAIIITLTISFGGISFIAFLMAVYHPAKATLPVNDTITITDSAGIIDDENAVYEALEEFQDISGVTVCIETVYDRTWAGSSKYYSLEDYAYSSYVNTFDDEKHWLFVMSFPEDYETCEFVNWRFEGMIGDDFFYTISSESEDRITKLLNDALLRYAPEHVDSAIVEAFDKFGDTVLDVQVNWILVVVGFIFLFLYIFAILGFIIDYMDSHHVGNGVNVPNNARELKCSYCGNAYIVGTVIKCPSCGAPLSYKEQQNQ